MLVSVITPCFNADATISATLASVQAQEHRDWEAIVVNDGSTDASAHAVSECAASDARIRLVDQANAGPSCARNRGLQEARGDLLLFLDADDWVTPDWMSGAVAAFNREPQTDVVYCRQASADAPGHNARPRPEINWTGMVFNELCEHNPFPPGSLMLRRTSLDGTGAFDPGVPGCEDWDMWLQVARRGARFAKLERQCFFYRHQAGSFSRKGGMMWESGSATLARAFSRDARVTDPDPQFAAGGPAARRLPVLSTYALACCGIAIADADADTAITIADDAIRSGASFVTPHTIADGLRHNLWEASRVTPGDWDALWPCVGTALHDFLAHLETCAGEAGLAGKTVSRLLELNELQAVRSSSSYRIGRALTKLKWW